MRIVLTLALLLPVLVGGMAGGTARAQATSANKPVVLDRVVAVINGDVLLESDVNEEMRFSALEPFQADPGRNTPQRAMRRLINRSLMLEQMKDQQQFNITVTDADVQKSLEELRSHLPVCAKYDCKTDAGWKAFLAANGLTAQEVDAHWKQRLTILKFIDLRFRTGIRIPQQSIEDYYTKSVVPVFQQQHQTPPPLKQVTSRIQEVLLQQQVNGLLRDWLKSLRDEGSVQILDPAYASLMKDTGDEDEEE
jgi:hypothetical protein